MLLSDFDYRLPREQIAQTPLAERDASRLLVLDRQSGGVVAHRRFRDLPDYLEPGDLLVLNETRVTALRLHGTRATGGSAEVFLTHRIAEGLWQALVKPGKSLREGAMVTMAEGLSARIVGIVDERGGRIVEFTKDGSAERVEEIIDRLGRVPLPPYIADAGGDQREVKRRYQTVYAREPGSAAAPTAGLHFTDDLMRRIRERGVRIAKLVLHVGVGTFLPIIEDDIARHTMHAEPVTVPEETASAIAATTGRIIAVGTTVLRALESAAIGKREVRSARFDTDLFITPGYEFKVVDSLITNFHMPRSTLLVLVAAFAGREPVLAAYGEALKWGYRFLSFGDAMFIAGPEAPRETSEDPAHV